MIGLGLAQWRVAWLTNRQERDVDAAVETLVENLFTAPARARAGEQLRLAFEDQALLRRHTLLLKSADQFLQAGLAERDPARARVWFGEALESAREALDAFPLRSTLVMAAIVDAMAERGLTGWDQVVAVRQDVLRHDPRHTASLVRLAEAHAEAGDLDEARIVARRALDVDDSFRMDPLRQLPGAVRERCAALAAEPTPPADASPG
jgi:tetratricopeptide (TPR) repeat protein